MAEVSPMMQNYLNTKEQYKDYIQSQGFAITIDSTNQKLVKKINEE